MASNLDNLIARKAQVIADLAAITSRASYSIDGQSVDHNAYRKSLLDEITALNVLITTEQGPFEVETVGRG